MSPKKKQALTVPLGELAHAHDEMGEVDEVAEQQAADAPEGVSLYVCAIDGNAGPGPRCPVCGWALPTPPEATQGEVK